MNQVIPLHPDSSRMSSPDPSIAANDDGGAVGATEQAQAASRPPNGTEAVPVGRRTRPRPNSWVPNSWGDPF